VNRVAVIGGGWAGIAAAVELVANGQQVTLYEAGRRLGGRARGVELDGQPVDNGQHILLGAYRDTLTLMWQVGANPEQLFDRRPLQIIDPGVFRMALPGWLPAPFNLAWALLRADGVYLREKVSTARWMESLKRQNYQLATDCSVAEWLEAGGQDGILARHLWGPLCLAALNTPPERASAQVFCNVLRDSLGSPNREDTDLLLPRGDLSSLLPEPAGRWLAAQGAEMRHGQRVKDLIVEHDAVYVDGEAFAAAIVATAPQHATELTGIPLDFDFEPIATVYLDYGPDTALPFPMQAMSGGIGQWVIDRGNGLLACVLSGHGEWEALTDEALAATLHQELGQIAEPAWFGVIREKRATLSCRPGLPRPGHCTEFPNVWLAGDYTWADYPSTLEGAVRSGRRAAQAALQHLANLTGDRND